MTPSVDERLLTLAEQLERAYATVERLEDEAARARRTEARALRDLAAAERRAPSAPRLAVNKAEAATALGVSVDFFDEHIAHELAWVRRGRRRLYRIAELERWLEASSDRADAYLTRR